MAKEIVTTGNGTKAVGQLQAWGPPRDIDADNFLISKVLAMQPGSKLVTARKATFGEFRDSVTGELLGAADKPINFIPLELKETWSVSELVNNKWTYKESVPYNKSNSHLAKEETINGVQIKRVHNMDFYVLLMSDLLKGIDIPKIISFYSTSERAGKVLYTQMFVLNARQGLSPAGMVMSMTGKIVSSGDQSWMVKEVSLVEKAHAEYTEAALKWFKMISAGKTKVDEASE